MAYYDLKNAVVKFKDGTSPTPTALTIKLGDGNLTVDVKQNYEYLKDRGKLDSVRKGDEDPLDVSLEGRIEFLKHDGTDPATLYEILTGASSWASTDSDACAPFAVDIEITYTPVCSGVKKEVILLPDFRAESVNIDIKAGMLNIKGRCNALVPTLTRIT